MGDDGQATGTHSAGTSVIGADGEGHFPPLAAAAVVGTGVCCKWEESKAGATQDSWELCGFGRTTMCCLILGCCGDCPGIPQPISLPTQRLAHQGAVVMPAEATGTPGTRSQLGQGKLCLTLICLGLFFWVVFIF